MVVFNRSTNVRKLTCIWSIQYISPNIPVCGWHHNYRERVAVNKEMTEPRICSGYFEVVTSNVKRHHHKFNPYKICTLKTTTDVPFPIITALSFSQTNRPVWNRSNIMGTSNGTGNPSRGPPVFSVVKDTQCFICIPFLLYLQLLITTLAYKKIGEVKTARESS